MRFARATLFAFAAISMIELMGCKDKKKEKKEATIPGKEPISFGDVEETKSGSNQGQLNVGNV